MLTLYQPSRQMLCLTDDVPTPTRTFDKLMSFMTPAGPISSIVLRGAVRLYGDLLVLGFTETDAQITEVGDVVLTARQGRHVIELKTHQDQRYSLYYSLANDIIECRSREKYEILKPIMRRVASDIWAPSPASTIKKIASKTYSTPGREGFDPRRNLAYLLNVGDQVGDSDLATASLALRRLEARSDETIEAWAENLASDLSKWTD